MLRKSNNVKILDLTLLTGAGRPQTPKGDRLVKAAQRPFAAGFTLKLAREYVMDMLVSEVWERPVCRVKRSIEALGCSNMHWGPCFCGCQGLQVCPARALTSRPLCAVRVDPCSACACSAR